MTWRKKKGGGCRKWGAFKLLPLQFRRWEWVHWIMDLFIGLEKKEEQQSWYQSGLKPLDLWGFSAMAGGLLESAIYQLRPNQNQAFRGLVLSHAKCYIRVQSTWLVKAWLIKKKPAGPALRICLQIWVMGRRLRDEEPGSTRAQDHAGISGPLRFKRRPKMLWSSHKREWENGCKSSFGLSSQTICRRIPRSNQTGSTCVCVFVANLRSI